ncbi:efflux RND transporter periplasmic adaptor subunit [Pseudomonas syringae]|uniref:efflux RND transporter periplasmic adaptor subunit n=1 Tax=Pseudomonas syringae TaxID=317 RepID=UPI0011D10686|nr:efflux RND transporter periplasmic adaptor subunit [Pseudomonas syringae]
MSTADFAPWTTMLAVAAGLMLIGCHPPETPNAQKKILVDIVIAVPSTQAGTSLLTGRMEPYLSAQVRARVEGIVQERTYIEGEDVKVGELLFRIDPAQLDIDLASAEAEHAKAFAAAEAAQDIAQRSKQLVEDHSISIQQYRKDFFSEKQARAMEQAALAKVSSARLQRLYADVTSPITGRARKALVSEGTMVGKDESTVLTTVEQIDPIYVDFAQPVSEFLALRKAHLAQPESRATQTVNLVLVDGSRYSLTGTLKFSDSAVNPRTDTVALRAVFANPDHLLLPGMYVQVEVERASAGNAILIPQQALSRGQNGAYVMVEDKGLARQVDVWAYRLEGKQWRIDSGLSGGEKVILEGGALRDGQPVEIKGSVAPADNSRS